MFPCDDHGYQELWPLGCTRANGSPSPTPCEMCTLLAFPALEAAHRHSHEIEFWCWDHLDSVCDWAQRRPLYTFKILAGGAGFNLACGLSWKSPSLLNLSRYQTGASFFHFSLPSMYEADFRWYSGDSWGGYETLWLQKRKGNWVITEFWSQGCILAII